MRFYHNLAKLMLWQKNQCLDKMLHKTKEKRLITVFRKALNLGKLNNIIKKGNHLSVFTGSKQYNKDFYSMHGVLQ